MDLGLTDRVFVVTGGSRGLGHAAARTLVEEGARVVLAARDADQLGRAVAGLGGGSDRALGVPTDLRDPEAQERLTAAAVARFGRLDGALLSCGGPPPGSVLEMTDEDWRGGFESVFLGPLRVARAVVEAMEAGGSLAFVLSSSAREPIPGLAVSNGLRPGMAGVVKDLADELGPRGIRVNGLMPGRINTDRTRELDAKTGRGDSARRRREAAIPLGRYGDPVEFGTVAAFLLSAAASYLTGALVPVDGGARRSI